MKASLLLLPLLLFATVASATELTLEDIFGQGTYDGPEHPEITWIEGGDAYLTHEENEGEHVWTRHHTRSGKTSEWLKLSTLRGVDGEDLAVDGIQVTADDEVVLIRTNETKRWRYSYTADHWIYHRKSASLERLSDLGQEIHVQLAPDGKKIGFVHQGDLYIRDLENDELRRLTTDGNDVIFNGDPDWVYEEELGLLSVWWWSDGSDRIAYLHTDSSVIGSFPVIKTGTESYPELRMLPYPKAGFDNSTVTLRVVALEDGVSHDLRTLGPNDGYFARLNWLPDRDSFFVQWINRDQNELQLIRYDLVQGVKQRAVLTETSPGWVEVQDDLHFLPQGRGFLWTSERSGYRHVYHFGLNGELKETLTSGDWEVRSIAGVDEDGEWALLETGRDSHLQTQIDRLGLKDGRLTRLSASGGWHTANASPRGRYYLETASSAVQRPELFLRSGEGKLLRTLVDDPMEDLDLAGEFRFVRFHSGEGVELFGRIMFPEDFDSTQRYPVLMFCYGGPQSQTVRDRWDGRGRDLFHRLLTQDGFIVFSVDGRGTGGRGREFKSTVYRKLGQLEAVDQLAGFDYLSGLAYVDPARIALWGWSYGGYLTAMTLLQPESKLAAGIVVAPVTDWRYYDTIYTERYMGTPQNNPEGYHNGAPIHFVDQLDAKMLLIHGMSDDNVHPQNSMRLIDALQEAGKSFELMVYPNKAHAIRGKKTRVHLYGTMRDFLHRHLLPDTDRPGL